MAFVVLFNSNLLTSLLLLLDTDLSLFLALPPIVELSGAPAMESPLFVIFFLLLGLWGAHLAIVPVFAGIFSPFCGTSLILLSACVLLFLPHLTTTATFAICLGCPFCKVPVNILLGNTYITVLRYDTVNYTDILWIAFVHEFVNQIERKKWLKIVKTLSLTRPEVVWGGRRPVLAVGACPCWPDGPGKIILKTSTNTVRLFGEILFEYDCVSKSIGSWVQFEIGLAETIRLGLSWLTINLQQLVFLIQFGLILGFYFTSYSFFFILQKTAFRLVRSRLALWQITSKERGIIGPASLLHGWQWVLSFFLLSSSFTESGSCWGHQSRVRTGVARLQVFSFIFYLMKLKSDLAIFFYVILLLLIPWWSMWSTEWSQK